MQDQKKRDTAKKERGKKNEKTLVCILAIALCSSLLAACGGTNVSGKYVSEDGDAYDFNGHGTATVALAGETIEGYTYAVKAAEV